MHPLFSRSLAFGAYMLTWAMLGNALALLLTWRYVEVPWIAAVVGVTPLAVFYGVACLAAWFVCRAFPVDGTGRLWTAVLAHLTAASVTSAVWVGFGLWWLVETQVTLQLVAEPLVPSAVDGVIVWFVAGVVIFLLSSAIHYVFLAVEASARARRQALESAVLAREAELRALRAQVNPHFLYNSLHSVAALTALRPDEARQMAIGLGEFLRQSLALGREPVVTLAQELGLARQYLAIEQVRYAERLDVKIDASDEAAACQLPPLLLQPLIENAITHGIAGLVEGGTINVVAQATAEGCEVVVDNPYDQDEPRRAGTGVGLANVRARLRTHFGERASLAVDDAGGRYRVYVRWPRTTGTVTP